jgi:hypothetical protein
MNNTQSYLEAISKMPNSPISSSGLNRKPQNITYIPPVTIQRRPAILMDSLELFFYF